MQESHDLLGPGAGGRYHPYRTAPDRVGEAEPYAADQRGAGTGAHDQQRQFLPAGLQLDLLLDGDVVAEEQHVQPGRKRFVGLQGRVGATDRDDRHVGPGGGSHGVLERGRGGGVELLSLRRLRFEQGCLPVVERDLSRLPACR